MGWRWADNDRSENRRGCFDKHKTTELRDTHVERGVDTRRRTSRQGHGINRNAYFDFHEISWLPHVHFLAQCHSKFHEGSRQQKSQKSITKRGDECDFQVDRGRLFPTVGSAIKPKQTKSKPTACPSYLYAHGFMAIT